jgi:hypothetical protein
MHTVASLKAEHKTLAAAKAATGVRAASWAALVDKLNSREIKPVVDPTIQELQAQIAKLEVENTSLKQQLITAQNTDSDYFVSPAAEIVYSIINLDGEQRLKALGIDHTLYTNAKKAKKWRNDLADKVHPDKCAHPLASKAMIEITSLFENMVAA